MNLVTGGTGIVGGHVCIELLRRGEEVRIFARKADLIFVNALWNFYHRGVPFPSDKIECVQGDVMDVTELLSAMKGCPRVFHTAAIVSYHRKDRVSVYRTNVEGTANVVNAAIESGVEMLCHVSSIAALGRHRHGQVVTEKDEWVDSPVHTHYAISKHLAELEIWRGREEGLKTLIVNPGFIVGPGPRGQSSSAVFDQIEKQLPYYPRGVTGFVHASDVAAIMVGLSLNGVEGERVSVVSENRSFRELWTIAASNMKVNAATKPAPEWLLRMLWILAGLKELFTGKKSQITRESIRNTAIEFTYDNSKLRRLYPQQLRSLEESVSDAVRFIFSDRNPTRE